MAWGPQWHPVEQPSRMGKKCCYSQKSWESICCCFVQSPTHLSHITLSQPFRVKWEVYFSKEPCSFIIIVLTMFPHVYVYMCIVGCDYPTYIYICMYFVSFSCFVFSSFLFLSFLSSFHFIKVHVYILVYNVINSSFFSQQCVK